VVLDPDGQHRGDRPDVVQVVEVDGVFEDLSGAGTPCGCVRQDVCQPWRGRIVEDLSREPLGDCGESSLVECLAGGDGAGVLVTGHEDRQPGGHESERFFRQRLAGAEEVTPAMAATTPRGPAPERTAQ
jgi:hypothetical protein